MKKISYSIALCVLLLTANSYGLEPLKEGVDQVVIGKAKNIFEELDKNKDGLYKKDEDSEKWVKLKRFDANNDGGLDIAELEGSLQKFVDSPGKKLRNVVFKKVGKRDVVLDFYFPDVDNNKNKPLVIYTHGGGWAAGSKYGAGNASFNVVHKALLKKGFCIVSVGYRLVNKSGATSMRDCVIDSKDALRFLSAYKEELGIDPTKIYTFGDSAGGHLAQMVLLSSPDSLTGDPELAKFSYKTVAGVSWYGPCDFQNEQLFNHDDRANFNDRFGPRIMGANSKPEEKLARYKEMSPVTYLKKESPPLLMIQGDKDTTIPVKQAHRMQEALKTIDAPVEIMIIKNAGHNWRSVDAPIEPNRDTIIQRTIDFIIDHHAG